MKRFYILINLIILCLWLTSQPIYGFQNSEVHDWEMFLDETKITLSGPTLSVNRPTKNTANPITDFHNDDLWDDTGCWNSTIVYDQLQTASPWGLYYNAQPTWAGDTAIGYCTGTSFTAWTRPTLGLYDFGTAYNNAGTNNNIVVAPFANLAVEKHYYNNEYFHRYLGLIRQKTPGYPHTATEEDSSYTGVQLWRSADRTDGWDWFKTAKSNTPTYCEGKDFIQFPDGTWGIYYVAGHATNDREIFLLTTADQYLSGTWSDYGRLISTSAVTAQKYQIKVVRYGKDNYLGVVPIYNSSTYETLSNALYYSKDGKAWALVDNEWLVAGTSPAWDSAGIYASSLLDAEGRIYVFYDGTPFPHDTWDEGDYYEIGTASLVNGRIGQASGSGTIVTDETSEVADYIYINCDTIAGDIDVELLDPSDDSVISGYAQSDCDTISETDSSSGQIVTWNGSGVLPDYTVKIKFYLAAGAVLYNYKTASPRKHTVKLTVDHTKVLESGTYLVNIQHTDLPTIAKDSDYDAMQTGGGDVIASYDEDGNLRIPCDIVRCVSDSNPANAKIQILFPANLSSTVDTDLYLRWGTENTTTQPAEDADYGKQNAYNYVTSTWLNLSEDPSGSAPQAIDGTRLNTDATSYGSMTTGDLVDTVFGPGLDFDGSNDYLELADFANPLFNDTNTIITFNVIFNLSTFSNSPAFFAKYRPASGLRTFYLYITTAGKLAIGVHKDNSATNYINYTSTNAVFSTGVNYLASIAINLATPSCILTVNGVDKPMTKTESTPPSVFKNSAEAIQIGAARNAADAIAEFCTGTLSLAAMDKTYRSSNYQKTCYNLWLDTANTVSSAVISQGARRRIIVQ